MSRRRISIFATVMTALAVFSVLANIVARLSKPVADFYVQKIYPAISTPLIFLAGLLPFSLGEWLIIAAAVLFIAGIIAVIAVSISCRGNIELARGFRKIALRILSFALVYVLLTETFGCFVMYQCTPFSERYFDETEHTEELLIDTIGAVADALAELTYTFDRGEDGYIILSEDYIDECKTAMVNISSDYSQLSGYYPNPKGIFFSYFMSQEGIIGLYIPFAFEATYNRDTQDISKPATICHELAHLKGIIQEDEASLVAMVACFKSESDAVRYSGLLDAFYYLYSDAGSLLDTEYEDALREAIKNVPAEVWSYDLYSFKSTYWKENEDKEIIPTETVQAISDALTDANLKFNDVSEGIEIYYRVAELLMDYYYAVGEI